ncbi:MAG: aldolase/citrate lyase family protein [Chthoniobacter sp.]|nr:aldolase/citrate lyase family protein [Chthoniobacter sp.]
MQTTRPFSERLRGGELLFGTLVVSPSPMWPRALEGSGLDFVFIDTEHIALDRGQVSWMCQAYSRMGLPPIVRIPSPDPFEATKMLDGGAAGIIAPYIETVEQAQALRGAVKLRPLKGRRLEERLTGGPFEPELEDYVRRRNSQALILNIESVPAIEALDQILAVPDLDAVLIGPHDLSCSLGVPEQYTHPKFREAVRTIFGKARAAGIGAGVHFWGDLELEADFARDGANMLIHSADISLFQKHLRLEVDTLKSVLGAKGTDRAGEEKISI